MSLAGSDIFGQWGESFRMIRGSDLGKSWGFLEETRDGFERLRVFGLEIKIEDWIKRDLLEAPEASNCKKFIYDLNNIIKSDV